MTDKQIIIDEIEINPNDWLDPYKPIPACEIKDCDHLVYAGDDVYGCRIAEDGLVCDDFNNDDECCMYRQLEYYKEAIKAKEQECEELREVIRKDICSHYVLGECSQKHHNNCVGRNQCIKDLEQECEELKKQLIKCDDNIIVDCEYSKKDLCSFIHRKKEVINGLQQQLDQLKAENEELKKANIHIDNNRMVKADKLKRIEDLIIACSSGYTDEFIQELLVILHEPEPCFKSKLSKTLTEIKEIMKKHCRKCKKHKFYHFQLCCTCKYTDILQKISEVEDDSFKL